MVQIFMPNGYVCNYGKEDWKAIKIPSFGVITKGKKCVDCKKCTKNCIMGLQVNEIVKEGKWNLKECINCGECGESYSCKAIDIKWRKD